MKEFFQRLFRGKEPPAESIKTAPLSIEQLPQDNGKINPPEPAHMVIGTGQSRGLQRDHNEDSLFVLDTLYIGNGDEENFGVFIIADGMGGHQHGEIASGVAIRTLANHLIKKLYIPFYSLNSDQVNEPVQEIIQEGVVQAQTAVMKHAPGGGTTLTCAFVMGDQVTLAHVGDSRAYFIFPDGRMNVITRDHSLVRRLQELGQITEKEAAVHPQRNILYRAIGQGEGIDVDINTNPVPHAGYLMICTDGLWGVISETEIIQIIKDNPNPSIACHELVEAANRAGGPDNISVILVKFPS